MRLIILFFFTIFSYASEFPYIFSSTGDELYKSMYQYQKLMALDIKEESAELLEAYCIDANATLQKGMALDKIKDDPEQELDKGLIKSYVKELRALSKQKEVIVDQLRTDNHLLYNKGDFKRLKKIAETGFPLAPRISLAIKGMEKKTPKKKLQIKPKQKKSKSEASLKRRKNSQDLAYYTMSLVNLKDELYNLRQNSANSEQTSSQVESRMSCLNDITAINYWMIKVLKNRNDSCSLRDSIKQMKSYSKASMVSCGRDSMRYVEWHNRIKPYVGKTLFEAEAGCRR